MGVPATVCVPDWVDPSKARDIRAAGAKVVLAGSSYDDADAKASALARAQDLALIHPFDDPDVIEGQGTIGLELLEQVPGLEEVIVPLSGGGLVAGIGLALRDRGVRIVAVSAERAAVMHASLLEGRPVELPEHPTIASALSGGIGLRNRFSFDAVGQVVSEHVIVSESQTRAAVVRALRECRLVVEGGGAVGLAAVWSGYRPRGVAAVVVSGGNVDAGVLAREIRRFSGRKQPRQPARSAAGEAAYGPT